MSVWGRRNVCVEGEEGRMRGEKLMCVGVRKGEQA